jgi:hypothetical protein
LNAPERPNFDNSFCLCSPVQRHAAMKSWFNGWQRRDAMALADF